MVNTVTNDNYSQSFAFYTNLLKNKQALFINCKTCVSNHNIQCCSYLRVIHDITVAVYILASSILYSQSQYIVTSDPPVKQYKALISGSLPYKAYTGIYWVEEHSDDLAAR